MNDKELDAKVGRLLRGEPVELEQKQLFGGENLGAIKYRARYNNGKMKVYTGEGENSYLLAEYLIDKGRYAVVCHHSAKVTLCVCDEWKDSFCPFCGAWAGGDTGLDIKIHNTPQETMLELYRVAYTREHREKGFNNMSKEDMEKLWQAIISDLK